MIKLMSLICLVFFDLCSQPSNKGSSPEILKAGTYRLGQFYDGQLEDSVLAIIGKPDSIGMSIFSERSGNFIKEVFYKKIGLIIVYESTDSTSQKSIRTLTAEKPCTLSVNTGIKIGSDYDKIIMQYKNSIDSNTSYWGKQIVVGSIYGGMIFTFDKAKVSKIFIGAAAD